LDERHDTVKLERGWTELRRTGPALPWSGVAAPPFVAAIVSSGARGAADNRSARIHVPGCPRLAASEPRGAGRNDRPGPCLDGRARGGAGGRRGLGRGVSARD